MIRCLLLVPLLLVAACAQSLEARVATGLQDAGLSQSMSQCMAERWVKRLSILQLHKIQSVSSDITRARKEGRLTVSLLIERVHSLHDPEIADVVTRSAAVCALTS